MIAVWEVPEGRADWLYHLDGGDCRAITFGTTEKVEAGSPLLGVTEQEKCQCCGATILLGAQ